MKQVPIFFPNFKKALSQLGNAELTVFFFWLKYKIDSSKLQKNGERYAIIAISDMAKTFHRSEKTISRHLKALYTKNLIDISKRSYNKMKGNEYHLKNDNYKTNVVYFRYLFSVWDLCQNWKETLMLCYFIFYAKGEVKSDMLIRHDLIAERLGFSISTSKRTTRLLEAKRLIRRKVIHHHRSPRASYAFGLETQGMMRSMQHDQSYLVTEDAVDKNIVHRQTDPVKRVKKSVSIYSVLNKSYNYKKEQLLDLFNKQEKNQFKQYFLTCGLIDFKHMLIPLPDLTNQIWYSINTQVKRNSKTPLHALNNILKLLKTRKWSTPRGFGAFDPEQAQLMREAIAREKAWEAEKMGYMVDDACYQSRRRSSQGAQVTQDIVDTDSEMYPLFDFKKEEEARRNAVPPPKIALELLERLKKTKVTHVQ